MKQDKIKQKSIFDKRDKKVAMAFLSPSVLGVAIFFVLPLFVVIYFSFVDNPISKQYVGFDNYINVATNMAFGMATKNTLIFSLIAVPLAVVLGLLLALLLSTDLPLHSFLRSSYLTPLMVPSASVVLVFTVIFSYNGVINKILRAQDKDPVDFFKSSAGILVIVVIFLWKNLGYNMILYLAALGSVPGDLIDAAKLDGAGKWKIFCEIKLRYVAPMIVFTTIFSLINSFKIFREIYLLTGDYPFETLYMLQHYMNNTFSSGDYQKLSTAAVLMCIVMCIITVILFKLEDKYASDLEAE